MPMILRGRFSFANCRSCEISSFVQGLPTFLVDLVIDISPQTIITKHLLTEVITVDMPASDPSTAFGILNSACKAVGLCKKSKMPRACPGESHAGRYTDP